MPGTRNNKWACQGAAAASHERPAWPAARFSPAAAIVVSLSLAISGIGRDAKGEKPRIERILRIEQRKKANRMNTDESRMDSAAVSSGYFLTQSRQVREGAKGQENALRPLRPPQLCVPPNPYIASDCIHSSDSQDSWLSSASPHRLYDPPALPILPPENNATRPRVCGRVA